jgi:hypothetical protein
MQSEALLSNDKLHPGKSGEEESLKNGVDKGNARSLECDIYLIRFLSPPRSFVHALYMHVLYIIIFIPAQFFVNAPYSSLRTASSSHNRSFTFASRNLFASSKL